MKNEYEILREMNHPNIVKLYSMINFSNFLIISIKLAQESLDDYSRRRYDEGNPLTELELSKIAKGVLSGIKYIHEEKNLIHCDIKPLNIVVGDYQDLTKCWLIDFGLAIKNNSNSKEDMGNVGTFSYQPPE